MNSALKTTLVISAAAVLCWLAATRVGTPGPASGLPDAPPPLERPTGLTVVVSAPAARRADAFACTVREDIATPLVHVARRGVEGGPFAC